MPTPEFDIPVLARHLALLANVSFEPLAFESGVRSLGWDSQPNEYAPDDEVVLEVHIPQVLPALIAVFSTHSMAGLPLYVLMDDPSVTSPYYRHTIEDFDATFEQVRHETESTLGEPFVSGEYTSEYVPWALKYALWSGSQCYLALMQHDEGDGNYSHGPTIDFRLLPKGVIGELPTFPLETDLIF